MKTKHTLTWKCLALAAAAAVAPVTTQAAGLLGHRSIAVNYEWTKIESAAFDHGSGFNAVFNQPLSDGLDLTASYAHAKWESARPSTADVKRDEFFLAATFIGSSEEGFPYLRFGLGWAQSKSGGASADALMHSIEIGAEFGVGRDATLTPFANWRDSFDGKIDGTLSYGLVSEIACGRSCSVLVRLAGDDHCNWTGGLGFAFKF